MTLIGNKGAILGVADDITHLIDCEVDEGGNDDLVRVLSLQEMEGSLPQVVKRAPNFTGRGADSRALDKVRDIVQPELAKGAVLGGAASSPWSGPAIMAKENISGLYSRGY